MKKNLEIIMHQKNCQDSIKSNFEEKISRLESAIRVRDIIIKNKNKKIKNLNADIRGLCKCENSY